MISQSSIMMVWIVAASPAAVCHPQNMEEAPAFVACNIHAEEAGVLCLQTVGSLLRGNALMQGAKSVTFGSRQESERVAS